MNVRMIEYENARIREWRNIPVFRFTLYVSRLTLHTSPINLNQI